MSTLLKPITLVKEFPEVIEKTRKVHPVAYYISIISLVTSVALILGYFLYVKPQADAHKTKLDEVALDLDNQRLFRSYEARVLYLQRQLLDNSQIKNNIGEKNIGEFSVNVISICETYRDDGLTPAILLGLIEVESGFKSDAVSESGALGLMQILRSTSIPYLRLRNREFSVPVLKDPIINMKIGTDFLIDLQRMYISQGKPKLDAWRYSLLTYNGGELFARDQINVGNNYATKVLTAARHWQKLGV